MAAFIGSGRRIRTCRILVNSQAPPPRTVDRNNLVDHREIESRPPSLQGMAVPQYVARILVPRVGFEPTSSVLQTDV